MSKTMVREAILRHRDHLLDSDCKQLSSLLLNRLLNREEYVTADELYTYVSFGSEADTFGLITSALLSGKKVFVPKVFSKGVMEFYQIFHLGNLVPGKFGILEPDLNDPKVAARPLSQAVRPIVVMPGVAFDRMGHRIGYGGGYYDRYLSREGYRDRVKAALCYECQMVDRIEPEDFDIPADMVITEKSVYEGNHHSQQ